MSLKPIVTVLSFDGMMIANSKRVQSYKLVNVGADQVVRDRLHVVDATGLKAGDVILVGDTNVVFIGDGKFRDATSEDRVSSVPDDRS